MAPRAATKDLQAKPAPIAPKPIQQGINGVYFDRHGNPISRKGSAQTGEGWAPIPPQGWDYLWIRIAVRGNEEWSELHQMMEAGWRPVPHSRHPNLFTATNDPKLASEACILKQGQLLMERPIGMTVDAQNEARRMADAQYHGRLRNHGIEVPQGIRGVDLKQNPKLRGGTHVTTDDSAIQISSDANYTLADE